MAKGAEPTPTPSPSTWKPPAGGFQPSGRPVDPKTGGPSTDSFNGGSDPSSGAWATRPQQVNPYWTSGTVGQTYELLNDYNSGYNSAYYDVSDLKGAYTSLDANTQMLLDAVSKAKGGRSGSALFDKYAAESARMTQGGGQKHVLDYLYEDAQKYGVIDKDGNFHPVQGGQNGSGSGYGPYQNKVTQLTNQFDAEVLVDDALNSYLGRQATGEEKAQFWKQLNAKQKANPGIQAGVTSAGGRSEVNSGGFNKEQFAEDFAKSRTDYAETQSDTTLMSWLDKSVAQMDKDRIVND